MDIQNSPDDQENWRITYHFVWQPMRAKACLTGEVAERLRALLEERAGQLQFQPRALVILPDRVYLAAAAPPSRACLGESARRTGLDTAPRHTRPAGHRCAPACRRRLIATRSCRGRRIRLPGLEDVRDDAPPRLVDDVALEAQVVRYSCL